MIWEMEHYNLNVLSFSETKVKGNSMKMIDEARYVHWALIYSTSSVPSKLVR